MGAHRGRWRGGCLSRPCAATSGWLISVIRSGTRRPTSVLLSWCPTTRPIGTGWRSSARSARLVGTTRPGSRSSVDGPGSTGPATCSVSRSARSAHGDLCILSVSPTRPSCRRWNESFACCSASDPGSRVMGDGLGGCCTQVLWTQPRNPSPNRATGATGATEPPPTAAWRPLPQTVDCPASRTSGTPCAVQGHSRAREPVLTQPGAVVCPASRGSQQSAQAHVPTSDVRRAPEPPDQHHRKPPTRGSGSDPGPAGWEGSVGSAAGTSMRASAPGRSHARGNIS